MNAAACHLKRLLIPRRSRRLHSASNLLLVGLQILLVELLVFLVVSFNLLLPRVSSKAMAAFGTFAEDSKVVLVFVVPQDSHLIFFREIKTNAICG